jgi:hypothetical protein
MGFQFKVVVKVNYAKIGCFLEQSRAMHVVPVQFLQFLFFKVFPLCSGPHIAFYLLICEDSSFKSELS